MNDLLDLPPIDAALIDEPQSTAVAVVKPGEIDLEKVDLQQLALAQFGPWRETTAKLKTDNEVLVLDLTTQTKVDEAKSLRERTINVPLAGARKIAKGLKSKLAATSKAVGAELDAIELAYDAAEKPLTAQIDAAQTKIDEEKEAKRLAEEKRLEGLRSQVDEIMNKWLLRAREDGITAERIATGIGMLQALALPAELADVSAHWATAKPATVTAMTLLQEQAQRAELTRQREVMENATQQILGIQQQVIIAASGLLGVRTGGTIDCIRETLAETEAWVIDEANFGPLTAAAQIAKDGAIASIKAMLADRIQRDAEDVDIGRLNGSAAKCEGRDAQYITDELCIFDNILLPGVSKAARVQAVASLARTKMLNLLAEAKAQEAKPAPVATVTSSAGTVADATTGEVLSQPAGDTRLLHDESRPLFSALASKPDAKLHAREAAAQITQDTQGRACSPADAPATVDAPCTIASNTPEAAGVPSGAEGPAAPATVSAAGPANDDPGPLETSEAEAIEPKALPVIAPAPLAAVVLASPIKQHEEIEALRAQLRALAEHALSAFGGRFPSQPKPSAAWFAKLRELAEGVV